MAIEIVDFHGFSIVFCRFTRRVAPVAPSFGISPGHHRLICQDGCEGTAAGVDLLYLKKRVLDGHPRKIQVEYISYIIYIYIYI